MVEPVRRLLDRLDRLSAAGKLGPQMRAKKVRRSVSLESQ
jgi:hypothetical protein